MEIVGKALQFIPLVLLAWFGLYMLALFRSQEFLPLFLGEEETFWGKVKKSILFLCVFAPLMTGGFQLLINSQLAERWDEDMVLIFIGIPMMAVSAMTSLAAVIMGIVQHALNEQEAKKEEKRLWLEELKREVDAEEQGDA